MRFCESLPAVHSAENIFPLLGSETLCISSVLHHSPSAHMFLPPESGLAACLPGEVLYAGREGQFGDVI